MVKTILVDKTITDGRELLRAIDEAGIPVDAAMWSYQPETDDWQFIIATPLVDTEGSNRVYARIQDIMDGLDGKIDIDFQEVSAFSPKDDRVRMLTSAKSTGPDIAGMRIRRSMINGAYIQDAYVYRTAARPDQRRPAAVTRRRRH